MIAYREIPLLLIVPRTATFGALICLADMIQVFMLNMTYDVPVKLFAFHLILLSCFLLTPDFPRLVSVLLRIFAESDQNPRETKGRTNTDLPGGHEAAKSTFDQRTQGQQVVVDPKTGHQVAAEWNSSTAEP